MGIEGRIWWRFNPILPANGQTCNNNSETNALNLLWCVWHFVDKCKIFKILAGLLPFGLRSKW